MKHAFYWREAHKHHCKNRGEASIYTQVCSQLWAKVDSCSCKSNIPASRERPGYSTEVALWWGMPTVPIANTSFDIECEYILPYSVLTASWLQWLKKIWYVYNQSLIFMDNKIFSLFQDVYAFSSYMYNRPQISIIHGYESALSKKVAIINNHTIKYTKSFLTGNNFE